MIRILWNVCESLSASIKVWLFVLNGKLLLNHHLIFMWPQNGAIIKLNQILKTAMSMAFQR